MARILVVEDEVVVGKGIQRILEPDGHEVVLAANGIAAMAVMDTASADLVVTDLYMGPMDGIEFIIRLREANTEVPVIAISGGGWESAGVVLRRVRKLGVRAAVEKPFNPRGFRNLVQKVLKEQGLIEGDHYDEPFDESLADTDLYERDPSEWDLPDVDPSDSDLPAPDEY